MSPAAALPVALVTGFEPFGGDPVNPSWEIASRLEGWVVVDAGGRSLAVVRTMRLPCVFGDALTALDQALATHRPVAVVALGLAGSRQDISVERIAINIDDARIPDNRGRQPVDEAVCPQAPAAYWSSLPIKAIVTALQDAGIAASVSQSAGTFVCNHVFFGLAHRLASLRPQVRGGFIHVPWPAGQPTPAGQVAGRVDLETAIEAIRIALQVTLTFGEGDLRRGAGAID